MFLILRANYPHEAVRLDSQLSLLGSRVQEADVYLLDDVLAAVDASVAEWLLQHALCGPLLRHRTRILCSHSPACAQAADLLVHMCGGRIVGDISQPNPPFDTLLEVFSLLAPRLPSLTFYLFLKMQQACVVVPGEDEHG